ncbi:MAG: ABC transporter substrate-binding protein [Lachnospiraceae bacterium]
MRKTRNRTAVLAAAVMTLAMVTGCGTDGASVNSQAQADGSASGDSLRIGVVQMMDNGAFSDMREGYMEKLKELYPDREVEFVYENAQGDASALNTICQQMADSDLDAIATIATPASQAMVNMEIDTPVFFVAVSDPVGAGLITDMEKPDKNATGTSNAIPVEDIFALCDELTPGCETYGLLYNTSEANSVSTVEKAKEYLDSKGISYVEQVVTNSSEVQQAAQALMGQVDAVFVPNDSMIQSAMSLVTEEAREAKVPVYGSSAVMVESGAFATIAISDKEIGAMTAEMTAEYLNGTAVTDIPSIVVPASSTVINQTTADALGITFTDDVKNSATFITETTN